MLPRETGAIPPPAALLRPGREWDEDERRAVLAWLLSGRVRLLAYALRWLGPEARWEDAEDALQDFCLANLGTVLRCYDPVRGELLPYFVRCFRNWCSKERRRRFTRARRMPTRSLDQAVEAHEKDAGFPPLALADPNPGPEARVVAADLLDILWDCTRDLPVRYRAVVESVAGGRTYEEIAAGLAISRGAVKVRMCRARQMLRDCLRRKGAEP
jgi:RNA polymerase sigma factor (sigma-70 family)